jgi:alpha-L-rhamnosidase
VMPHLGRRLTSVAGVVPTVHGPIEAAFDFLTGKCRLVVPNGTLGRVGIPKEGRFIRWVFVNGRRLYDGGFHPVGGIAGAAEDDGYIYLDSISPGIYDIFVFFEGSAVPVPTAVHPFEANFLGMDVSTQGNWKGTYGKDGYVLCNYGGGGADSTVLPAYVRAVSFRKNGTAIWTRNTNEIRALQSPGENPNLRNAAYIHTQDPFATYQTMTVDIETKASAFLAFRIALYFVDWDDGNRTSAVEMFDLESKKLISPLKIVSNYKGGRYLVYSYHQSCRFRINQVRGENAVLSGVFFDVGSR